MKKLFFADLDDTLFQSHRKQAPADDWAPLAYLKDGSPISSASPQQQAFLLLLMREMTLIPVTARNRDAFSRVRIPFEAQAIINYGGVILDSHGAPDPEWLAASRHSATASIDMLKAWADFLAHENAALGGDANIRLISDFDIPFYVVAKSACSNVSLVSALFNACQQALAGGLLPDLTLHHNHNNLALIPRWLNKKCAVAHLRRRYEASCGPVLSFGMGDSLVDLDFMSVCDYQIIPGGSQIADILARGVN